MTRYLGIAALLIFPFTAGAWAQNDPLIGTWKLSLSKSMYDPGPPPQSSIQKYESAGKDSYKITRDSVDANGKPSHSESTIVFDGKEHASANALGDSPSIMDRRIDSHNLEGMSMRGGKLVQVFLRFVSEDGRTLTFKTMGINAERTWFSRVEVFDKQ